MQTQFIINGMTCNGCKNKVLHLLSKITGVNKVEVSLENKTAILEANGKVNETEVLNALKDFPQYTIGAKVLSIEHLQKKSFWSTYKPIFLIFIYLILLCTGVEWVQNSWSTMHWMNNFMAGFFLIFSFFKLLNVKGFAASYAMYDIVAKRFPVWGFIYPFIELTLGLGLLFCIQPFWVNCIVLIVMCISIIGVLKSVLQKTKIKCACLGDVFNLPMSTITIIEDGLMIAMSVYMLLQIN